MLVEELGKESTVLPNLKKALAHTETAIDNMLYAIQSGIITPSTKQRLEELKGEKRTIVFYEAPHKLRRTLDDLAAVTGGSPEYAGRLFKKLTGITFSNYLTRCRIELACVRLKNTSASVSEIAAELGYYDIAYFDKCFKKIIGIAPSRYRMNLAAGESVKRS